MLKEWQDVVLAHGWAYSRDGTALKGKTVMTATTAGGSEAAYCRGGHNLYTMREFLAPIERTAVLCDMTYLPPFVIHGTHSLKSEEIERHADDYRRGVEALRDGTLDAAAAEAETHLNAHLDLVLPTPGGD